MVSNPFEKDAASKQRYLKGLNIDIDSKSVPCVSPDAVGDKSSEKPVEVEEEEQSEDGADDQLYQENPAAMSARSRLRADGRRPGKKIPVKILAWLEGLSSQARHAGHADGESRCRRNSAAPWFEPLDMRIGRGALMRPMPFVINSV